MPATKRKPASSDADMQRIVRALGNNWMLRKSNNGKAHSGFKWGALGVWTEAPDWNPEPVCGGGLHGQGPGGFGYSHKEGTRLEFCETDPDGRVIVEGNKVKVRRARILWIGAEASATRRMWLRTWRASRP